MKKVSKKIVSLLCTAMMVCTLLPVSALAAEGDVAQIGETTYATLDEAVEAAADGDTIELLADATTTGLNLSKDLTIQAAVGVTNPTITFTQYGIALWGKSLTFKDVTVVMTGIGSTPYTGEWSWMTICASKNASLSLNNTTMTMDGTGAGDAHAIYFCSNNKLNLTNSSNLTIKNYQQDALEWDGGDGGYNVNITNSSFTSDSNRSGFTGTFYATITNSNVDVINSSGNGSNGSHFLITDSTVNFKDNGSHGLSAGILRISNSTVNAIHNGYNGIIANKEILIDKDSKVLVKENTYKKGVAVSAFRVGYGSSTATCTIEDGADVQIINNYMSGIQVENATCSMEMNAGTVTGNGQSVNAEGWSYDDMNGYGGGVRTKGTFVMSDAVKIYNNAAVDAGDDIYVYEGGSATLSDAQNDGSLELTVRCDQNDPIDGWYDDSADNRWEAHAKVNSNNHAVKQEALSFAGVAALKAAHGFDEDAKTSYPGLEKKIVEGNEEKDSTSVAKNDTVNFKLTSNVPEDLKNYLEADPAEDPDISTEPEISAFAYTDGERGAYRLTFHDQMDSELSFNNDVVVTVNGKTLAEGLYTVTTGTETNDDCTFHVTMDLVKIYETEEYFTEADFGTAEIVVTYSAKATGVTAGKYENTAWVEYEGDETTKDIVTVKTYGIKVFKYDQADNEGLAGAEFELKLKGSDDVIATLISGDGGYVTTDGLKEGTYTLTETKAPEGYVKSDEALEIKLPENADAANYIASVKFANSLIPHTGGRGTALYTIGGLVILAVAGILFIISRKKKEDA